MARRSPYKILLVVLFLCGCSVYFYHREILLSAQWRDMSNWMGAEYNESTTTSTRTTTTTSTYLLKNGNRTIFNTDKPINLDDIYITVKTSEKFHKTRVAIILKTWWNYAKNQTYFFTDSDDPELSNITDGRSIKTTCGASHDRGHLCCKMGKEYDSYYDSGKKWWCHFDDDNYVHVELLVTLLQGYDWTQDLYIGRPSYTHAVVSKYRGQNAKYWFATGGAGVCITRPLSEKMAKWTRHGEIEKTCKDLGQSDDCTIGFIISNRLEKNFIEVKEFNSHIQDLTKLPAEDLTSQIVLSYHLPSNFVQHAPSPLLMSKEDDPTRMLSHHCLLYPATSWCPKNDTQTVSN